ncbi:hypothetical protein [Bartonella massiliensis]|uniref:hypothetical protein n=1 Tax=Bartonella massiliensis TaxID=929795 RepID=UPI00115859A1|nr:hypothetical protein [Bartonella massiliensis]
MKKTIILIATAVTLGIQNPAMGFIVGGVSDASKTPGIWSLFGLFGGKNNSKTLPQKNTPPQEKKVPLHKKMQLSVLYHRYSMS